MRRVNVVFAAIVVGAVLAGGVTASTFGSELRTVDTITRVQGQIDSTVTELQLADQELLVTVRVTNPTGYPIGLHGTFVRVFFDGPDQVAYGAGERLDDGPRTVPPRGALTARYVVGLTPEQSNRTRTAFESGPVRMTLAHQLSLRDESFHIVRPNVTATGDVSG